jgi:hypothetical protein
MWYLKEQFHEKVCEIIILNDDQVQANVRQQFLRF